MKISIGADHAGFEMKQRVIQILQSLGHDVRDVGTQSIESVDYPPYAFRVAEAVRDHVVDRGILLCDSGNGIAIAANKVDGVRAALCTDPSGPPRGRRPARIGVLG